MSNQKLLERMQELRSTIKDASNASLKLHQELTHDLIISGEVERDDYTLNYLLDNNATFYRHLNAFIDNKLGHMQGRLLYGELFDELCSIIKNVPTKENIRTMAAGNMATLIIEKPRINSMPLIFMIDVNRKKSSITFKLGGTDNDRISVGEIQLTSKGNLCYSSIYTPSYEVDYEFGKRLKNCVKEDPVKFLTNLIAEIKSVNDGNVIFSEFNNDEPIITDDLEHHHTINSIVLSLLRIYYGYKITDSLNALRNKEFNRNNIRFGMSDDFYGWTERFFEEKKNVRNGKIVVHEDNIIKIANRYIIRFDSSDLYFYISKKAFNLNSSNVMKIYLFSCDSEEIYDRTPETILDPESEEMLKSLDKVKFVNKYTKLLAYANYFENWNEIIEKAFDVENNIKGEDHIKNFVSMINHFMNYDLSI
jgi:hypothetical protein|nr:MAG TPA: hypothetical protein [Caudoviricetes sp.]